ncbi:MAG TPA: HAMP domain-containing protein [Candidatus Binatia bacterium]|jgi:HAMP domain-containing protein|nr:HAMP domain-containing protein [Candidatus Binatia bacterium]
MNRETRRLGLKWKIGGIFTAVMLVLGALAIAAVYRLTRDTVRDQLDKRAVAIAINFSDAAAGHIAARNLLALHTLARKYTLLDGVAYAYVVDGKGEVLAQTLGSFPDQLRQNPSAGAQRQIQRRELSLEGKPVYETAAPVLDGQMGNVHVGFWSEAAQAEINRALIPIVGIIAIIPFVGALLSFLLAHWIVRPIVGLTEVADKVTMGDLETSVGGDCVSATDEIGDLARSLERMRSSLRAAMLRLGREVA